MTHCSDGAPKRVAGGYWGPKRGGELFRDGLSFMETDVWRAQERHFRRPQGWRSPSLDH